MLMEFASRVKVKLPFAIASRRAAFIAIMLGTLSFELNVIVVSEIMEPLLETHKHMDIQV